MEQQLCFHCGEPVRSARGKRIVDSFGKEMYTNADQEVYFHGDCRTEARRMIRKEKRQVPMVGTIRKWLKIKNKYGEVVFKPFNSPSN